MKLADRHSDADQISESVAIRKSRDTGLAVVLICLLTAWFGGSLKPVLPALMVLVLAMTVPVVFKPLSIVWFGFSHLLGTIVSRLLLTLIFYLLVTPIGMARRWMGADPLQLNRWNKSDNSAFNIRDKQICPRDIEKPF